MNINFFNNYKLGIDSIDEEHYKLFIICEKILSAIDNKDGNLMILIESLLKSSIEHFENEEEYMEKINFPYIKYHKIAHITILNKINELIINKELNDIFRRRHFMLAIDDILLKHIDHYDFQIKNFLLKK